MNPSERSRIIGGLDRINQQKTPHDWRPMPLIQHRVHFQSCVDLEALAYNYAGSFVELRALASNYAGSFVESGALASNRGLMLNQGHWPPIMRGLLLNQGHWPPIMRGLMLNQRHWPPVGRSGGGSPQEEVTPTARQQFFYLARPPFHCAQG